MLGFDPEDAEFRLTDRPFKAEEVPEEEEEEEEEEESLESVSVMELIYMIGEGEKATKGSDSRVALISNNNNNNSNSPYIIILGFKTGRRTTETKIPTARKSRSTRRKSKTTTNLRIEAPPSLHDRRPNISFRSVEPPTKPWI